MSRRQRFGNAGLKDIDFVDRVLAQHSQDLSRQAERSRDPYYEFYGAPASPQPSASSVRPAVANGHKPNTMSSRERKAMKAHATASSKGQPRGKKQRRNNS